MLPEEERVGVEKLGVLSNVGGGGGVVFHIEGEERYWYGIDMVESKCDVMVSRVSN